MGWSDGRRPERGAVTKVVQGVGMHNGEQHTFGYPFGSTALSSSSPELLGRAVVETLGSVGRLLLDGNDDE